MIKVCEMKDLDDIADIAYKLNNIPESNSAYCFKEYAALRDDFKQMLEEQDNFVIGYWDEEGLSGVTGLFTDKDKKTADCIGPFLLRGTYSENSLKMLKLAKEKLPEIRKYNFFFNQKNSNCNQLMKALKAVYIGNEYNLLLKRENFKKMDAGVTALDLPVKLKDKLRKMHDLNFKDSYISGNEMIQSNRLGRKVFCITQNDELAGYGSYRLWNTPNRASIEILYVEPNLRGQGYEEALLNTIIESILTNEKIDYIGIVIETKNSRFIEICCLAGFEIDAENCAYVLNERSIL